MFGDQEFARPWRNLGRMALEWIGQSIDVERVREKDLVGVVLYHVNGAGKVCGLVNGCALSVQPVAQLA